MTSTRTIGRDSATLRVQGWDGSSLVAGPLGGADPLGFAAVDANLYRYVGNDPTGMVDPSGLQEASLPDKKILIDISTGVIDQLKKKKGSSGKDVDLPGNPTNPAHGACAEYAKDMTDALKDKKIAYKLHYYKAVPGAEFLYTFPGGTTEYIGLNADGHVIVEVTVMSGGKQETIFFDSGIGVGGSLGKGNVGDFNTGVIARVNRPLKGRDGKDVLTGCGEYEYNPKQAK